MGTVFSWDRAFHGWLEAWWFNVCQMQEMLEELCEQPSSLIPECLAKISLRSLASGAWDTIVTAGPLVGQASGKTCTTWAIIATGPFLMTRRKTAVSPYVFNIGPERASICGHFDSACVQHLIMLQFYSPCGRNPQTLTEEP